MNSEFGIRSSESQVNRKFASSTSPRICVFLPHSAFRIPPSAMTLIELLIVIVILATLTAAALPLLTPSTMERRIREASRGLNMHIAQAQAKAVSTQRPVGFAMKRLSAETGNANDSGVCIEVISVEQPVPYAGFDENSRMRVALNPNQAGTVLLELVTRGTPPQSGSGLPVGWVADMLPENFLRYGDVVEVLGTRYQIVGEQETQAATVPVAGYVGRHPGSGQAKAAKLVGLPLYTTGQALKPVYDANGNRLSAASIAGSTSPYWTEPAPYKIYRQPVPTSADPFQLPDGTAIDLEASGIMGELPFHAARGTNPPLVASPVYIMFSPEGSIERVQYARVENPMANPPVFNNTPVTPSSSVSLLVGRRELIPADMSLNFTAGNETENETEKAKHNHLNLESRWVSIGASTGAVVTTENARVRLPLANVPDYYNDDPDMFDQRRAEITAAQEFARGMRRIGGG